MRRRVMIAALALSSCGGPTEPKAPVAPSSTAPITPAPKAENRSEPRERSVGPDGERAEIAGTRVKIIGSSGGEEIIDASDLHAAPGDRALRGISPTALLFLDDGTLLVGSADGTVTAIRGGRRRHSLGFRGAIQGLTPAGDGLVAVTTQLGVIALITPEGKLRWERQVTAEPLVSTVVVPDRLIVSASHRGVFAVSMTGELAFTHASPLLFKQQCNQWGYSCKEEPPSLSLEGDRIKAREGLIFRLDDPHPPVPSLAPTFPLTFHKVLDGKVTAVLGGGPGDVWALVKKPPKAAGDPLVIVRPIEHGDEFVEDRYDLVHIEGSRVTRLPVPHEGSKKEVFMSGARPEKGSFHFDGLVPGPDGVPWIIARRINWDRTGGESGYVGALQGIGQILEARGGKVRERNDFFATFMAHPLYDPIAAASEGQARFCFGHDKPACATLQSSGVRVGAAPERIRVVRRIGAGEWVLTREGKILRGERFEPVEKPEGEPLRTLGGAAENDVWGASKQWYSAMRWDGARWTAIPVPAEEIRGFVARAADDVWLQDGRARWDGKQWSRVFGAPLAAGVIARAKDDVWMGGDGLHHGTAPGPSPVRLPAPASPDEGVFSDPGTLPLGAPEAGYAVERVRLTVTGDAPLTGARSVSASADGVLWLQTWDRLVELDGTKATTLRRARRHAFARWAQPEAKGRGFVLEGDEVLRVDGHAAQREDVQLDHHRAIALDADKQGSMWLVGMATSESDTVHPYEHAPHALVRAGGAAFRPVIGLPSAAWCAVAAAPDGGAFFAGGLNTGPAGEGILFHARGRLGGESSARFRAPAALLAVTAASANEAWAAGAAGHVIHVRGGAAERFVLPSGEWLRAALALAPDDVWIAGDEGTLLHYDGRVFHPLAHGLDAHASFTGLAAAGGAVWAVGPSGLLRITRRR